MKLTHSLSYLPRGFGDSKIPSGQCLCVEELFKSTVGESTQQSRTDLLASQTPQDLQLALSVNEMFDLRSVDAEKKFPLSGQPKRRPDDVNAYGGVLGKRQVALSLAIDGVWGRSLGGETTYTAFVKAPLRRSTSISPPRSNGSRLHPLRRRVWDNRTISILNCNQASFSFTARLLGLRRPTSGLAAPPL